MRCTVQTAFFQKRFYDTLFRLSRKRQFASVAQLVEQGTENPRVGGSIPPGGTKYADVAHLVERHLAKVEVASSSLVIRSSKAVERIGCFFLFGEKIFIIRFVCFCSENLSLLLQREHQGSLFAISLLCLTWYGPPKSPIQQKISAVYGG